MKKTKRTKKMSSNRMPQVHIRTIPINSPKERQEILMNLATSSEFEMRHRGIFEYYGKDFITYKRLNPSDEARNEFLRIIAAFMAECLEDNCPTSWKQCKPPFWEELIFTFYPHRMHFSPDQKETEKFIAQLLKFVRWLDQRAGTSWYPIVEEYSLIAFPDLQKCENMINYFILRDFPQIHHKEFNPRENIKKVTQKYEQFPVKVEGIFEVTAIVNDSILLSELETNDTYGIQGLPVNLVQPGMIFAGSLGKQTDDLYWYLYLAIGIYPQTGKKYIACSPK